MEIELGLAGKFRKVQEYLVLPVKLLLSWTNGGRPELGGRQDDVPTLHRISLWRKLSRQALRLWRGLWSIPGKTTDFAV